MIKLETPPMASQSNRMVVERALTPMSLSLKSHVKTFPQSMGRFLKARGVELPKAVSKMWQ